MGKDMLRRIEESPRAHSIECYASCHMCKTHALVLLDEDKNIIAFAQVDEGFFQRMNDKMNEASKSTPLYCKNHSPAGIQ